MPRFLHLILACMLCISAGAFTPAEIEQVFAGRHLMPVEGVWRFPDDGAVLMIVRESTDTYTLVLLDSPDLSVVPGTIIGSARESGVKGVYDADLDFGDFAQGSGRHATLHVGEGVLAVKPYTKGWSISLKRLFYRLFKVSVSKTDTRPDGLDGAVRVYPFTPSQNRPVCL